MGRRRVAPGLCVPLIGFLIAAEMLTAHGRDLDGGHAAENPELHQWLESLQSGGGCCSYPAATPSKTPIGK
jgi:hypothetical protein